MRKKFLCSAIIVATGVAIMVVGSVGGLHAMADWSDAYHFYVRSGGMGEFELYEAELSRAAYAWLFDVGMVVAFGGLAILGFAFALEKSSPSSNAKEAQEQTLKKNDEAHGDNRV